jgi:hypothetical protein
MFDQLSAEIVPSLIKRLLANTNNNNNNKAKCTPCGLLRILAGKNIKYTCIHANYLLVPISSYTEIHTRRVFVSA